MIELNGPWTVKPTDEHGVSRITDADGHWIGSIYENRIAWAVSAFPEMVQAPRAAEPPARSPATPVENEPGCP